MVINFQKDFIMNRIEGNIKNIETCKDISLIKVECDSTLLSSIIIETPLTVDYLKIGGPISVLFKETEVIISRKAEKWISLQNQLPCRILAIKKGKLLSSLTLDFKGQEIGSIITSNAVNNLELEEGMDIYAMIKTNEMMLSNK